MPTLGARGRARVLKGGKAETLKSIGDEADGFEAVEVGLAVFLGELGEDAGDGFGAGGGGWFAGCGL